MDNFKDALKLLKIDDALIDQLKSTQHGDIEKSPNHLEGDVFTHTEMVFKAGQQWLHCLYHLSLKYQEMLHIY